VFIDPSSWLIEEDVMSLLPNADCYYLKSIQFLVSTAVPAFSTIMYIPGTRSPLSRTTLCRPLTSSPSREVQPSFPRHRTSAVTLELHPDDRTGRVTSSVPLCS